MQYFNNCLKSTTLMCSIQRNVAKDERIALHGYPIHGYFVLF